MGREKPSTTGTVVVVLDGDTDAGYRLARRCLADGHRVAALTRHPADAVRIMHGYPADRVVVIAADPADRGQWRRVTDRVVERFGGIDAVVRGTDSSLQATA